jgi:hypothetical protein
VSFTPRHEGLQLRGWLFRGSPGGPYLIFVHGIGDQRTGNRISWLPEVRSGWPSRVQGWAFWLCIEVAYEEIIA